MQFQAKTPVGKIGVVIETPQGDTAEVVAMDVLRLQRFLIDYGKRQIHMTFAWGGFDKSGVWHWADGLEKSERTVNWQVDGEREIFESCALCPKGNPLDADQHGEVLRKILFDHEYLANVLNSTWHFKEMELSHQGKVVFMKFNDGKMGPGKMVR